MGVTLQTIIQRLEETAPLHHAQSWDKCGLQIGELQAQVNSLLISLDVSEQVVTQAASAGVELIIAHHPLFFTPLDNLNWQNQTAGLTRRLIQANINLYIAHTNLDASPYGASDYLAGLLNLESKIPLAVVKETVYKLAVFVPNDYVEKVRIALGRAGAGVIGDYSYCAFQIQGKGVFKAGRGTNPFAGKGGEFPTVDETRLETIVPERKLRQVIAALLKAHPYEETAYDLYPVMPVATKRGLAVCGSLPQPLHLLELAEKLKNSLKLQGLRWVGDSGRKIKKVAVCGGSGADLINEAKRAGAQALITGDVKYHQARDAQSLGLAILDIGHFACEYQAMQNLSEDMKKWFHEEKWSVTVLTCRQEADPFNFYL